MVTDDRYREDVTGGVVVREEIVLAIGYAYSALFWVRKVFFQDARENPKSGQGKSTHI